MKNKILLVSVKFMSLYQDIINELEMQGYEVTFLDDVNFGRNFYDLHKRGHNYFQFLQGKYNSLYWKNKVKNNPIDYKFDYFLCIDGFSLINSGFIEFLESQNPAIKKILYLFDRTYKNYRFDLLFPKFDKVFSFDRKDCQEYGLQLLPIYWVPLRIKENKYDVFGFGTYMKNRYMLFQYVDSISKLLKINSYIKIYLPPKKQDIVSKARRIIRGSSIPDDVYSSPLLTQKTMSPDVFREYIASSHIVLDTHDIVQDGLTARFMWALGAGSKIITTNESARNYPFYNDKMIKIVDINNLKIESEFFDDNNKANYDSTIINQYRIDNWLKTMLT